MWGSGIGIEQEQDWGFRKTWVYGIIGRQEWEVREFRLGLWKRGLRGYGKARLGYRKVETGFKKAGLGLWGNEIGDLVKID